MKGTKLQFLSSPISTLTYLKMDSSPSEIKSKEHPAHWNLKSTELLEEN